MNNKNGFNYIYLIESHQKDEKVKLYLAKRHTELEQLEEIQKIDFSFYYDITMYRFKIYPNKSPKFQKNQEKFEIIIKLLDFENNKFEKIITNLIINQDNFLYDFKFDTSRKLFKKRIPPVSLDIPHYTQFELYLNYLKNNENLNKDSTQINSLILSIQKEFQNDLKLDLIEYLLVFKECNSSESIKNQLIIFEPDKINVNGNKEEDKKIKIKNMVDAWEKNPDIILSKLGICSNKKYYNIKFITIIFYFNYIFYNQRIFLLINNEHINQYLLQGLFTYPTLFNLFLPQNDINKMISLAQTFDDLLNIFRFNNNTQDLLQAINDNINIILSLFINRLKQIPEFKEKKLNIEHFKYPFIEFAKYAVQDKKDDLNIISKLIKNILIKNTDRIDTKKLLFIKFQSLIFEKYMELFNKDNLDNLIIIKELSKEIQKYDKSFEIKKYINNYIHDTGLYLSQNKKLNNIQILNYIKNDIYFSPNSDFIKSMDSDIIFSFLDINNMDQIFKNEWKKIDWKSIYDNEYPRFSSNILDLINNIKNFDLIFDLLSLKELKKEDADNIYEMIMYHYFDLLIKTYKKESCPNLIDITVDLIYYIDTYSSIIEKFISELEGEEVNKIITKDVIYEIYMKILAKHENISKELENKIVSFIFNKDKGPIKSYILIYLNETCKYSKEIILSHINNDYKLTKEELFKLEETENIKLLHLIMSNGLFFSNNPLLNEYKRHTTIILSELMNKISKYNMKYNEIEPFFADKNLELFFKKRLLIIYLMDRKFQEEKFKLIKNRIYKIKEIIHDLEILIDDIEYFFINSKKNESIKIKQLIKAIKENNLNYCQNNNKEIEQYNQYINNAKKRIIKKKSAIYLEIFKREKEKIINDDDKCLNNTEEKLIKFQPYLICKIINNIDEELYIIIKSLKLNHEQINNEANILMNIYNLDSRKEYNKLINSIICLHYKEKILKLISSVKNIIEISKVQKDVLYGILNTILENLQKSEIVKTIQLSIKILKIHYIDIFDENSKFNKLLLKFYGHPEYIQILLGITIDTYERIKIKDIDTQKFQEIMKFIKFFENKEKIEKMKDKELIKMIKNEMDKVNETTTTNNCNEFDFEIDDIIKLQN